MPFFVKICTGRDERGVGEGLNKTVIIAFKTTTFPESLGYGERELRD